jgi:preprotein translocase subunit SecA
MKASHIDPLTGEDEENFGTNPDGQRIARLYDGPVDPNDPRTWGKVQRNAPCPCGSGRKFKQCHGALV